MSEDKLEEAFDKAAQIAKKAPKHLQEIAYNRALDALLSKDQSRTSKTKRKPAKKKSGQSQKKDPSIQAKRKEELELLLSEKLDSTSYPEMLGAANVLERSLIVLKIAKNQFKMDGLTSFQIAKVITSKFRLKTSRQAVNYALSNAADKVNRVHQVYQIMRPGEAYLDLPREEKNELKKKSIRKRSKKIDKSPKVKSEGTTLGKKPARRGLRSMLIKVKEEGFFNTPRTAAEVGSHLETKRAFACEGRIVTMGLFRLTRDGILDRDKNPKGTYEYKVRKK